MEAFILGTPQSHFFPMRSFLNAMSTSVTFFQANLTFLNHVHGFLFVFT